MPHYLIIGPCLKMGGMERASANMAISLDLIGLEVSYISIFKTEKFFTLTDTIKFQEPPNFNEKKLSLFQTIKWLRKQIIQTNPDIIICFNKFYAAITKLSVLNTGIPLIISERSSPLFKWPNHVNIFNNFVFKFLKPDGVIAQTNIAKSFQKNYYKNVPIEVIPNIISEFELHPEIIREKIVLAVGRFNDHLKGFDRLIKAFSKADIPNDWRLIFVGGEENESIELRQIAIEEGILNRIDFMGKVKDLSLIYAKASLFVIPSRSEGFPNALLEAMGAGLPCVSYNFIAGPADLITNDWNGILVKEGDINELAIQIKRLVSNNELRLKLGKNALTVRNDYNRKTIANKIVKFAESIYE